jgi:hypothetical protein
LLRSEDFEDGDGGWRVWDEGGGGEGDLRESWNALERRKKKVSEWVRCFWWRWWRREGLWFEKGLVVSVPAVLDDAWMVWFVLWELGDAAGVDDGFW